MSTDQIIAEEQPLPRRAEPRPPDVAAVRSRVTELEEQARNLVREQPVVAVLLAAGVGYLVARVVARAQK